MKTLLHICCGPCSLYCIDDLRATYPEIELTGLYANPNIHPKAEFLRRMESTKAACAYKGIPLEIVPDFDQYTWEFFPRENFPRESFLGESPSGEALDGSGKSRCHMCYTVRMERTARYAAMYGYDAFTSTLFVSPYQDHACLQAVCEEQAARFGVRFLYRDFRPGFRQGQQEAREIGLYRQKYCGCIKSLLA